MSTESVRKRLAAATPGPWRKRRAGWYPGGGGWEPPSNWGIVAGTETWHKNRGMFHPEDARYPQDEKCVVSIGYDRDYNYPQDAIEHEPDADLIAQAPTDLALALPCVDALREFACDCDIDGEVGCERQVRPGHCRYRMARRVLDAFEAAP